jgi:hypothetical protein
MRFKQPTNPDIWDRKHGLMLNALFVDNENIPELRYNSIPRMELACDAKTAFLAVSWITLSGSLVLLNKCILTTKAGGYVFVMAFAHMATASFFCEIWNIIKPKNNNSASNLKQLYLCF